jgi:two-component system sensor histidine kinase TtrS
LAARPCVLFFLCLLLPGATASAATQSADVRIGVLAKRGDARTVQRWQATADYLSEQIPGARFQIAPLDFEEIYPAVERGEVDFILCNSAIYVDLERRFGIGRIATLRNLDIQGLPHDRFGGVVFTRAGRRDLTELEDLVDKRFAAVKDNSFGGYIMALWEMRNRGIDPQRDFQALAFVGTHDAVVQAVAEGRYDAGTVRTDTLERMAGEGLIELAGFRIISPAEHPGFSLQVSTELYPEWPFAKLQHSSGPIANRVASVLLGMPADAPAAKLGQYDGWSVPGNYQKVHEVMRNLRIGPYEQLGDIRFSDLLRQYEYWILAIALLGALLIASNLYIARLNFSLRRKRQALQRSKSQLERNYQDLKRLQNELVEQEKMASLGRMVAGFAHEVNTPIGVAVGASSHAREAAGALERLLEREEVHEEELREQIEVLTESTGLALSNLARASDLVQSFKRTTVDQTSERPRAFFLAELIEDVITSLHNQFKRSAIVFKVDCPDELRLSGIPGLHSQLLTNLIMNSRKHGFADGAADGKIQITARLAGEDRLYLEYRDSGAGMTPETLQHIYEPFFTTDRSGGGSGLGMYICYNLVTQQLGGAIEIDSAPGAGMRLRIEHPVNTAEKRI